MCLSSNTVLGQMRTIICGKVKSTNKFIVNIYEPIYGYNNIAFFDSSSNNSSLINKTDSIFEIINIDEPAFVTLYFTTPEKEFITRSDVLMFPGDSLHLHFDLSNEEANGITYGGSNAMGQKLFNEINYSPVNKFILVFDILDKLPENDQSFAREIINYSHSIRDRFDSLQKTNLITKRFVEYMDICFKSVLYSQVVSKLLRESKKSGVIRRDEKETIITQLFTDQSPKDERLKGLYTSEYYLDAYYNFLTYKRYNLKFTNELNRKQIKYFINGNSYLIAEDFVPFTYIKDKQNQKDLWALRLLYFYNFPGKYDFSLIKQYDSIFPNNKWSILLKKKFKSMDIPGKIEYLLQSPIHFVDTAGISSLDELLNKLPENKPFFIDLWATWCTPCVAAFGFNRNLDTFLMDRNIERVYVSLDGIYNYARWRDAIDKYALGGYHILANDSLKNNIKHIVYHEQGKNAPMGIPRYVLVNNGKVIIDDAISPTELDLLEKEITKALKL